MTFVFIRGNPDNLVGGADAAMGDIQGPFYDIRDYLNGVFVAPPAPVSALPGSPTDGQEVYYIADATNGILWHLRYRAASSSAYKWEFVGGPPLSSEFLGVETLNISQNTWGAITANDPKVTVPLAGDYDVEHRAAISLAAGAIASIGVRVGATEPIAGTNGANATVPTGGWAHDAQRRRITGIAATTVLQQRYFQGGAGSTNFSRASASMAAWPVRVG